MRDVTIEHSSEDFIPLENQNNSSHKMNLSISITSCFQQPSKEEIDAFRMKAITLLKNNKISFSSLKEQLHTVPILVEEKMSSESIITMLQTISMPNETIQLKGVFKRYSEGKYRSIPIPESFQCVSVK